MDKETVSYTGQLIHWFVEHWQFSMLIIGGAFWGAVWSIKKVFPTHKVMRECENNMRVDLEKHEKSEIVRFNAFKTENLIQHQSIESRLDRIIDHLINKNHG